MARMSTKPNKEHPKASKVRSKGTSKRKAAVRTLNGIPLKRRVMWVYDTDSPEFKAVWEKERIALRNSVTDPEIDEFLDDAWRDIDRTLDSK
jgi:hypothetical protein